MTSASNFRCANASHNLYNLCKSILMCGLILLLASCIRLDVPTKIIERDASLVYPESSQPLALDFVGEDLNRDDFTTAFSEYRIFRSRIVNESGSIADILRPSMTEAMSRKGFSIVDMNQTNAESSTEIPKANRKLVIKTNQMHVYWVPPREFITTPTPRESGDIILDWNWEVAYYDGVDLRWKDNYIVQKRVSAMPGQESEAISQYVYGSLAEFIHWISTKNFN